jgi:hypothetical protein
VHSERALYLDLSATLDLRRVTFIDESGINSAMTRLYGRAPRGERALGSAPQNYGPNVTILGALSCTGLEVVMTIEGATDSDVFRTDVCEVLCPMLCGGRHRHRGPPLGTQGRGRAGGDRGRRGAAALPAAVLARPEPNRALLVKAHDVLACRQGAHPRGA